MTAKARLPTRAAPGVGAPALVDRGACPLCGDESSTSEIAFVAIPIYRCQSCAFLYSGRIMTPDGLANYYAAQVSNERLQQGQEVYAHASLAALERITPLPVLRRALDVGAGYGFLLSYLNQHHGIHGTGVEPSHVESQYGRQRLGVDIRNGVLSDVALEPLSFDLVCAFEVLEHTPAPRRFVSELAEHVAPGGYLVIGTDNFDSSVVRALGPGFPKWIPHTHVSHFVPATLTRLVGELREFSIVNYVSYTPWEFMARAALAPLRRRPSPAAAYDYEGALGREISRAFKFYRLRKAITLPWFNLNASADLAGEMMFIAARKRPM